MRASLIALAVTGLGVAPALAQDGASIAARVARAPDGEVRMQYASRPGTCGDGRDAVRYRDAFYGESMQGFGRWSRADCLPGPVRVSLQVRAGRVERVRTRIGGAWRGGAAADLGVVPARDAAAYFLALVPRLEEAGAAPRGRILLPAVLADSAAVAPQLLALARDAGRQRETRRQAVHWAGMLGDASVVPALAALARAEDGALDGAAMAALTFVPANAGVPALVDLARDGTPGRRRHAVFWLAQTDDDRAQAAVRRAAEDGGEDVEVRRHALFAMAHGARDDAATFDWMRAFWSRAGDDRLKESIAQGLAEDERPATGRWLLDRVRDARESARVRKQTLFWAGQREATTTRELVALVRELREPDVAKHGVFVLSQREDGEAVDALIAIAQGSADASIRKQAVFWLGQSDDPRAARYIRDLVTR
jgi:HEAT repeat protein